MDDSFGDLFSSFLSRMFRFILGLALLPGVLGANSNSLHEFVGIPKLVKRSILVTMIQ